jgi:Domain of Unknown Function (DUF1543)
MQELKLYMLLLGCTPFGRRTEQHDIFIGIGPSLQAVVPDIIVSWPEAQGKLHIDTWRKVQFVDGFEIKVAFRDGAPLKPSNDQKLFFINLGGYRRNEFEEFHYKMLAVGKEKATAVQQALKTSFYLHTGFDQANSHVDDKYGVDVDDFYEIEDLLTPAQKEKYQISVSVSDSNKQDEIFLGYFKLDKL